jgi:hypothetical protein
MNKSDLLKLAEYGVKERLRQIQAELNDLNRNFPHLVQNLDGSLPSVLPLEHKNGTKANGKMSNHERAKLANAARWAKHHKRLGPKPTGKHGGGAGSVAYEDVVKYLTSTDGPRTINDIAEATNLSGSGVRHILTMGKHRHLFAKHVGTRDSHNGGITAVQAYTVKDR